MDDQRMGIESTIRERAARDAEFRAALVADARAALGEALGVDIPASLNVRIIEEGADEVVLVVPAAGAQVEDLDDAELEDAAGGWCQTSFCSAGSCGGCTEPGKC